MVWFHMVLGVAGSCSPSVSSVLWVRLQPHHIEVAQPVHLCSPGAVPSLCTGHQLVSNRIMGRSGVVGWIGLLGSMIVVGTQVLREASIY